MDAEDEEEVRPLLSDSEGEEVETKTDQDKTCWLVCSDGTRYKVNRSYTCIFLLDSYMRLMGDKVRFPIMLPTELSPEVAKEYAACPPVTFIGTRTLAKLNETPANRIRWLPLNVREWLAAQDKGRLMRMWRESIRVQEYNLEVVLKKELLRRSMKGETLGA
jgi:hypothetical protein